MLQKRDLAWGYAAQALSVGSGLILLPAVVRFMEPEMVGLWFVFGTIAGLVLLMEQGFQPTITRNVAYVHAGAQMLLPVGLAVVERGPMSPQLLTDLLNASRWIYKRVALMAAALLLIAGTAYVYSVLPAGANRWSVLGAWMLFCAGNLLNFYFGYINAFILGRGDSATANQVIVTTRLINIGIGFATLAAGAGLAGLALATLVSAIGGRVMAYRHLQVPFMPRSTPPAFDALRRAQLVGTIWHNASRFGLVLLGLFLITRANVLTASSAMGLPAAASFGLAVQLFLVLQALASVPMNLALPTISALRANAANEELYKRFGATLVTGLAIGLVGAVLILVLGPLLLSAIGSRTPLPAAATLALMALAFLLELNHGICANLLASSNKVPFVFAYLTTGLGVVVGSILAAPAVGLLGLVVVNLCCQLVYNNWKWPAELAKEFSVSYGRLLRDGVRGVLRRHTP